MDFKIDLDAARRERQQPEGLPLVIGGQEFNLPAELPLDVFDPFLDETFDLAGLIREGIEKATSTGEDGKERGIEGAVIDILFLRPDLPLDIINRVYRAFEVLFGAEQYKAFKSHRPSLVDYATLFRLLFKAYGVGLGEAFASLASSGDAGEPQQPTSSASTESTSETPTALPSMAEEMAQFEEQVTATRSASSESDASTSSSKT